MPIMKSSNPFFLFLVEMSSEDNTGTREVAVDIGDLDIVNQNDVNEDAFNDDGLGQGQKKKQNNWKNFRNALSKGSKKVSSNVNFESQDDSRISAWDDPEINRDNPDAQEDTRRRRSNWDVARDNFTTPGAGAQVEMQMGFKLCFVVVCCA